jgi:acetyl-CoA carboxylase carboxyl transferase subunit beta
MLIYDRRLERNLGVCPECGFHRPLGAPERVRLLLDEAEPIPARATGSDPLGFSDTKPYSLRLAEARERTGLDEAAVVARGLLGGRRLIVVALDFAFIGGSLGGAVGELVTRAAELSLAERTPLLIITASGGARMQEGALALMQMAKANQALAALDEAGVLTIALVTDPTYGGVAASFATACDVIIAEPGARMGFAGPRVVEQTIKQRLPAGFQTAEFLLEHGLVDAVRPRSRQRATLARLLTAATAPPIGVTASAASPPVVRDPALLAEVEPMAAVRRARDIGRPTTLDYIALICTEFEELRGDRAGGDSAAIVGGIGRIGERPVMVIGHQRGHDAAELATRNYGMAGPAGYRKAVRLMRLAAKLGLPVVTLVDTPGADPGLAAEEQGQSIAISDSLRTLASLPVPVVSVVIGEGGSGGALALALADQVLMCEYAVYSVISPEGCAAILWHDPAAAGRAAGALRLDARALLELGVVDGVVPEPPGGAHTDHVTAAANLRAAVDDTLSALADRRPAELVASRRGRFRAFGADAVEWSGR